MYCLFSPKKKKDGHHPPFRMSSKIGHSDESQVMHGPSADPWPKVLYALSLLARGHGKTKGMSEWLIAGSETILTSYKFTWYLRFTMTKTMQ